MKEDRDDEKEKDTESEKDMEGEKEDFNIEVTFHMKKKKCNCISEERPEKG